MVATALVVSDLHLADGSRERENWGAAQQAAFEQLLAVTKPGGVLASATVELIINGDTFDFLLTPPNLGDRTHADLNLAHAKWATIQAAHEPWFAALRDFLRQPGHRVTFLVGNHDVELLYPSIRARVRSAIGAPPGMVRFCLTQTYQPFPDVVIDHGCQFDPYNAIPEVWAGSASSTPAQLETSDVRGMVGPLPLPWGARYYYQIFLPFKLHFRYLDETIPALDFTRQAALVSLLAPEIVADALPRLLALLPGTSDITLPADIDLSDPQSVFALSQFAAQLIEQTIAGQTPGAPDDMPSETQPEAGRLTAALGQGRYEALKALLTIGPEGINRTDRGVRAAAQAHLDQHPETRFYILGHTHEEGRWHADVSQAILNTGTWFPRKAIPHADEWNPEFAAWAGQPLEIAYPGRDGSRFTAAWLRAEAGAATVAELIAWRDNAFTPVPDDAMDQW
jgi:hypothetical protein